MTQRTHNNPRSCCNRRRESCSGSRVVWSRRSLAGGWSWSRRKESWERCVINKFQTKYQTAYVFHILDFVHFGHPCVLCLRWARELQPWNKRSKDLLMEQKWKMSVCLWTHLISSLYRCSNRWHSVFVHFSYPSSCPAAETRKAAPGVRAGEGRTWERHLCDWSSGGELCAEKSSSSVYWPDKIITSWGHFTLWFVQTWLTRLVSCDFYIFSHIF